ncbi:phosphoadenylyl-sulfate reductase [Pseudalkalibacillus salsuginis]|uniref:phosphoadenylyl-sulfate reductase n=1 Tax=Pseudalkalibacillus salsuginis TaxID=2910972 RepID=UPI001F3DC42F|nr:phosphoadenylyl-sulfate reductase [Pseudalkalibacillus salsuginis]MCF6408154.1 phosphoadenylyl-sulfate reductase [Pseudalkalibacillus salsuginis]
MISYETWTDNKLEVPIDQETKGAREVLRWAFEQYQDDIIYACSFGAEGIVLVDLISQVNPYAKVVFLDTGLHFTETYELIEKVKARYPYLQIDMKRPELTLQEQSELYGGNLWERDPNQCCHIRKVVPLTEALSGYKAWISGLRRDQSPTRRATEFINKDDKFQSIKICPLIHWSWKDVWRYINNHDLPYNILHDKGYPSIGCEKCTLPTQDAADLRSGRWTNLKKTECGLHLS